MEESLRDDALIVVVGLGVLAVFVVAEWRIAGGIGLPLDDSWIHVRFATNLARGRGFAINPGEPVAASTAPLWTLLLALGVATGLSGLAVAKILGVLAYVATALLTRRVARAAQSGTSMPDRAPQASRPRPTAASPAARAGPRPRPAALATRRVRRAVAP